VKALPSKMCAEIGITLTAALRSNSVVRVYAEAERIRQANPEANVALEDIVDTLIGLSVHGLGFEADPDDAREALLGRGASG
jgi:hypothetical protein